MCCCCGAHPGQTHLALTINSGILLVFFLIMACVMVSSTKDYKYIKAYIESEQTYLNTNYNSYSKKDELEDYYNIAQNYADLTVTGTHPFKYAKWFKNLKSYEMGIIITRLIVMALIFGVLIYECLLECSKKLPVNGFLYNILIGVYIFQIVFHILFSILSIVLGIAELLSMLQYGLLLPSGAKISGPILKRGATQISFTLFFFVYQLVFICLIVPVFGMFKRKELVGQGFDPYKKGASNSATSRELNAGSQNVIKKINE